VWLRMKIFCFLVSALILCACTEDSPLDSAYREIAKLPADEIGRVVCQKSPQERIELFLYGAEKIRPSDYGLMPADCIDERTLDIAIKTVRKSSEEERIFALIAVIHEASPKILSARKDRFVAGKVCSRVFEAGSSCHQLASDIDAIYGVEKP
jgi:hypothetical protein